MSELREAYLIDTQEGFVTVEMGLTPAEQRLIRRLRQLAREQCRGALLTLEPGGFGLFKLDRQEKMRG